MREGRFFFALAVMGMFWAFVGCRTSTPLSSADIQETIPAPSPEATMRANALAFYSQGLMDEYNEDSDGALSNFQQAVSLDPNNEELSLRVAIGLLQQKRQEEATALVESFARKHPDAEKAQLFLALVYRATEQYDKVERIYRQMIKKAPSKPDFYLELAAIFVQQGHDEEATKLLEQAVGHVDHPVEMLRVLGGLYAKQSADGAEGKQIRKNRDAAIHTYEQALKVQTNDVSILFQLGLLYIQDQQIGKALDYYGRIEQLNPENLQIRRRLALSFAYAGSNETAIALLQGAKKGQPYDPHIDYYLGELYGEKGDMTNALLYFSLAATNAPADPAPFIKKAILQVDHNPEAAELALIEGLERLPGDPRLTEMLGYVFFCEKKYDEAIKNFAQALDNVEKKTPGAISPTLYYNYAIARQMAGQFPEAAALLNKAIEKNPSYLDAYLQYAFRRPDDTGLQNSITVLEAVSRSMPSEPNVYVYLGILNSYLKTYLAAITAFEKAEALVEDSPEKSDVLDAPFYFWYAAACERDGQFTKAETLFDKCLELDPEHAEAYNYLAYMWAEKGIKLDQAFKYVSKALKINPNSGAFLDTLGWIYYRNEQYKEALEQINHAAEIIPDDPTILDHLGDVFDKLGDEQQALPHWKRSFLMDPDNTKVGEKLTQHGVDLEPLRKQAAELKQKKLEEKKAASPAQGESSDLQIITLPLPNTNEPLPDIEPGD